MTMKLSLVIPKLLISTCMLSLEMRKQIGLADQTRDRIRLFPSNNSINDCGAHTIQSHSTFQIRGEVNATNITLISIFFFTLDGTTEKTLECNIYFHNRTMPHNTTTDCYCSPRYNKADLFFDLKYQVTLNVTDSVTTFFAKMTIYNSGPEQSEVISLPKAYDLNLLERQEQLFINGQDVNITSCSVWGALKKLQYNVTSTPQLSGEVMLTYGDSSISLGGINSDIFTPHNLTARDHVVYVVLSLCDTVVRNVTCIIHPVSSSSNIAKIIVPIVVGCVILVATSIVVYVCYRKSKSNPQIFKSGKTEQGMEPDERSNLIEDHAGQEPRQDEIAEATYIIENERNTNVDVRNKKSGENITLNNIQEQVMDTLSFAETLAYSSIDENDDNERQKDQLKHLNITPFNRKDEIDEGLNVLDSETSEHVLDDSMHEHEQNMDTMSLAETDEDRRKYTVIVTPCLINASTLTLLNNTIFSIVESIQDFRAFLVIFGYTEECIDASAWDSFFKKDHCITWEHDPIALPIETDPNLIEAWKALNVEEFDSVSNFFDGNVFLIDIKINKIWDFGPNVGASRNIIPSNQMTLTKPVMLYEALQVSSDVIVTNNTEYLPLPATDTEPKATFASNKRIRSQLNQLDPAKDDNYLKTNNAHGSDKENNNKTKDKKITELENTVMLPDKENIPTNIKAIQLPTHVENMKSQEIMDNNKILKKQDGHQLKKRFTTAGKKNRKSLELDRNNIKKEISGSYSKEGHQERNDGKDCKVSLSALDILIDSSTLKRNKEKHFKESHSESSEIENFWKAIKEKLEGITSEMATVNDLISEDVQKKMASKSYAIAEHPFDLSDLTNLFNLLSEKLEKLKMNLAPEERVAPIELTAPIELSSKPSQIELLFQLIINELEDQSCKMSDIEIKNFLKLTTLLHLRQTN